MGGTIPKRHSTGTTRPTRGSTDDRVVCRTPTPGKSPTRIDRWKYESVRGAILDALADHDDGLPFRDLTGEVRKRLTPEELEYLGSVGWYTTTVKLELEVAGELKRDRRGRRQVIRGVRSLQLRLSAANKRN